MVKNTSLYMREYYKTHKDKYLSKRSCPFCLKDITISNFHKHLNKPIHLKNASYEEVKNKYNEINEEIEKLKIKKKHYDDLINILNNNDEFETEIDKIKLVEKEFKKLYEE